MLKKLLCLTVIALLLFSLAACTNTYNDLPTPSTTPSTLNPLPSASPSVEPSLTPGGSPVPTPTETPAAPTLSNQESATLAGKVDTRVAQVSEIAEAVTVVVGNQAIACVTFDSAYRGDLTDRIAESVSTAVKQVATGVTGCSVTNSAEIADKLKTLREKQSQGGDESEIKKEFEEIKSAIK